MEFNMEWDVICRICLQEGEMNSIYEKDDKDMTYSDKIMRCSNITIKRGMSLPEQICKKCIEELDVAYRFRLNCESSDAILQSLTEGNNVANLIMTVRNGEVYKFKPPQGLNVKRIKPVSVKIEPTGYTDVTQDDNIIDEDNFVSDDIEETICDEILPDGIVVSDTTNFTQNMKCEEILIADASADQQTSTFQKPDNKNHAAEQQLEVCEESTVCTLKPVKTNKARSKSNAEKNNSVKTSRTPTVVTKQDGSTVLRVGRNQEEQKPLKICEICGNTYKYKHALESHMRRHRNEKPFSCEICGRSFVINFELRRHMRTHTGQKPYACRYCARSFSDFGSRIKHERTHTGERPYKCETCGKAFAYSHVLSSHILTHTGEKRYLCVQCGKRFTKAHHLKAHSNTHLKNQNKAVILRAMNDMTTVNNPVKVEVNPQTVVEQHELVYEDVLTVLTSQPKVEQFEEIEEIHSEEENRQAVSTINLSN